MSCGIPDLELDLVALVAFSPFVSVKDGWLVNHGKSLFRPCHDDGGLTDGGISDKDQLHGMLVALFY